MLDNLEHSSYFLWRTDYKYYRVFVTKTLFDEFCLVKKWGSLDSHRGGSKSYPFPTKQLMIEEILKIHKKRIKRGYVAL